ncbi:MAG: hypothetical protein [Inoviridae sp.]|nr:MAG: hypothetical protein [Inoviridae sp.]
MGKASVRALSPCKRSETIGAVMYKFLLDFFTHDNDFIYFSRLVLLIFISTSFVNLIFHFLIWVFV